MRRGARLFEILKHRADPRNRIVRSGSFGTSHVSPGLWENGTIRSWWGVFRQARKADVSYTPDTPFDTIEGSHEYVLMLAESLAEARREVEEEIAAATREGAERRKDALLLASYNLTKLDGHITSCRRILNDLRTLRRLLLAERSAPERTSHAASGDD